MPVPEELTKQGWKGKSQPCEIQLGNVRASVAQISIQKDDKYIIQVRRYNEVIDSEEYLLKDSALKLVCANGEVFDPPVDLSTSGNWKGSSVFGIKRPATGAVRITSETVPTKANDKKHSIECQKIEFQRVFDQPGKPNISFRFWIHNGEVVKREFGKNNLRSTTG